MRALEVALLTGRPIGWWHHHAPAEDPPMRILPFVLEVPRELLYERIDQRIAEMLEGGLLDEVRGLVERYGEDAPGLNAHAYIELFPYFRGERSLDEALELARRNTKSYTRRQLTWFRKQLPEGAVWLDATRPRDELADEIVRHWTNASRTST
jgi:tRNA dimethylallyltransferase